MSESDTKKVFDLAVIGGGPGGYVCAIRAAQLGLRTAIIEKRPVLGGTCVNVGCIPTKALLESSELYHTAREGMAAHGVEAGDVRLNLSRLMERKTSVVRELTDGLKFLMKKNKITVFQGTASFASAAPDDIRLNIADCETPSLTARRAVIATGSDARDLPGLERDGKLVISSDEAIALDSVPEDLIVLGAGVIGLELGTIWNRLGSRVILVEMLPDMLPGLDAPSRAAAKRILEKQGLRFLFERRVAELKKSKKGVELSLESTGGEKETLKGSALLVAAGRVPRTRGLNAEGIGVKLDQAGRVEVAESNLETSVPGIHAIGDAIRGPMLAHKAEEEGVMVAEILAGRWGHVNYDVIPSIVYTWPEIAWVGRSEEELKAMGREVKTGRFFFKANGRAKAMGSEDGFVRLFADAKTDQVLGAAILGPNASELIAEIALGMEFGASAEDIARTCHAHPTLSEAVKEAALAVDGRALHA